MLEEYNESVRGIKLRVSEYMGVSKEYSGECQSI